MFEKKKKNVTLNISALNFVTKYKDKFKILMKINLEKKTQKGATRKKKNRRKEGLTKRSKKRKEAMRCEGRKMIVLEIR